jgi:hypothetical protein
MILRPLANQNWNKMPAAEAGGLKLGDRAAASLSLGFAE